MRYYRLVSRVFIASVLVLAGLSFTNVISDNAKAACATPLPTNRGTVTATVNIQTAGNYRVWSRIKTAVTANNSYFMQIDDTTCNLVVGDASSFTANQWTWVDYQGGNTSSKITVNLSAGNHVFTLAGREDNVQLDRVILTQDLTCAPTGNGDNCSDPADLTGPAVSLTAPTSGATISGTYNMTATATDASGIKNVEFYIDNVKRSTDTTAPYSYSFDTKAFGNGSHTFRAVATDNSPQSNVTNGPTISATITNTVTTVRDEDINSDGVVTMLDFSLLSVNFGKTGAAITNPRADINKDGAVNMLDFSRLSTQFGT
jgi:hypothetical protein